MYRSQFLRKHIFLQLSLFLVVLLSVTLSYAVSLDDVEISGFNVKDTAKGDVVYFEADLNNIGAYHISLIPYVTVFSQGNVVEEIIGDKTQIFSRRNKKIRIGYNTSELDLGQYTAAFRFMIDGKASDVVDHDFEILEMHQSVIIKDLDVEPTELGDVMVISAILENAGTVDVDYSVRFSIVDSSGNVVDDMYVAGFIEKSSIETIYTAWDTGKKQPGNYPVSVEEYGIKAQAKYWIDSEDIHESEVKGVAAQLFGDAGIVDNVGNVLSSLFFKLFGFLY
ncbi:MAG: hypothetical protein KAS90_04300 [Candidatus Aenigmarchaeota archaeon]|nr:hypothetical protein [Candidatus Aenigmarchaeota archaeon]